MGWLPWRNRGSDEDEPESATEGDDETPHDFDIEPVISCRFQDGKLFVFEDQLFIERPGRSKFPEKWIALDKVQDVTYAKRLVISYIQIEQREFDTSEQGLISSPVDENTLHFGFGKRDCARKARDAILERTESG